MIRIRFEKTAGFRFALSLIVLCLVPDRATVGHDGHAPLPTKGATVQGEQLLLSEKAMKSLGVETSLVKLADLRKSVEAQCQIQLPWHRQAHVTTLLPGRIVKLHARPGNRVEKNEELAEVESLEFETIQRDLLMAIAERKLAERLLEQREALARANTIPSAVVFENRFEAEEAAVTVEIAIRKLLALGLPQAAIDKVIASDEPIRGLTVRSPIRGEIASTGVRVGQVVAQDDPLFHIVDLSVVELAGKAIESDVPEIAIGQSVKADFLALPGTEFTGTVEYTDLEIDERTQTLMIIAQSDNPDGLLKPGMSGRMSIEVLYGEQAIVCHRNAISGSPTAPFVFLERSSGRYDRRFVKLGTSVGDMVEIREGLFPGDKVVVVGTGVMTSFFPRRSLESDTSVNPDKTKYSEDRKPQEHSLGKSGTSTIEAFGEVEVPVHNRHFAATQLEGRISRILVRPGVEVKTGQVLAEVASLPYYELQLELLRNLARYRWIRERKDRLSSLQESQAIRKVDLWEAETELIVIEHATAEIRAQLKALGMDEPALKSIEANGLDPLKRTSSGTMSIPVRAPADGRLDYFEITPGEVVRPTESGLTQPSKPLFEIHDRSKVWVCAHVRESQVSQLRIGQIAKVTFPAMPGKNVTGKVVRISPVIDPKTRVIAIWIEAENPDGHFFDNMQAKVIIETGSPGIIEADDSN